MVNESREILGVRMPRSLLRFNLYWGWLRIFWGLRRAKWPIP